MGVPFVSAEPVLVNIPIGTGTQGCEETDECYIPAHVTVHPKDEIMWSNVDAVGHTVTSGVGLSDEESGLLFDSGLLSPLDTFSHTFDTLGAYPYYCVVHPWMVGTINVQEAMASEVQVIHNVGQDVDENDEGVDVEYQLARKLVGSSVDTSKNTVTFTLAGVIVDDQFVVHLPDVLIKNPNAVWIDGIQVTDFESEKNRGIVTLTIPLEDNSERVEILGSEVIPEFDSLLPIVMVLGIIPAIILSKRLQART